MPEIRSVLVSCSAPPDEGSGIQSYAKEISLGFKRLGLDVHFMSPSPRDRSWLQEHGIRHLPTEKLTDQVESARQALDYITAQGIGLAVNNDNPVLQSLAPALPCPLIVVGHLNTTVIGTLACHQPRYTDHLVAISADMLARFTGRYAVPLHKCAVVLNGIADPLAGQEPSRPEPGPAGGTLRTVFLGGGERRKGGDLLLRALEDGASWEGISLDWYGSVPAADQDSISRHPQVRLMGKVPREELLRRLPGYDVLLFPSRAEGCPMAMLEAMSLGVPPIATDGQGAMKALIASGQHGYICALGQWPVQMLECLEHLRANPALLEHMKAAVRQRFLAEFQIERVVERLLELGSLPTVDRSRPPQELDILRWHRVSNKEVRGLNLMNRLCYRMGILRRAGVLSVQPRQRPTSNREGGNNDQRL